MKNPPAPRYITPDGDPLPAPAAAPPPPPRRRPPSPPAPPAAPPPPPWWAAGPPPAPAPLPDVHVDLHLTLTTDPDPEPAPRWYEGLRPGYNAACLLASLPLAGPWAWVLETVRDEAGIAGAWVIALVPLAIAAFADNVHRAAAAGANPRLWAPKVRAAAARIALCAALTATVLTLPVVTVVYVLTGVQP
ncbi:hypothetical protein [Streptomyces pini]|uniref:Uncharacterized protein n=1 Tax=Streptomyces pini TaxID=1520580 RepID=A0A1I4BYJ3_9ACTN|nr:hypothetical protein [Streptomyces pini]SFK73888.1 hypothetical protein SAMN05192584_108190 [Streptomyces pini]